ncbi:MAG: cobalt transporter [Gammaproteobacteria bacterium]|nr:cobalt transporter [Gammaproteobacteria bacterium]
MKHSILAAFLAGVAAAFLLTLLQHIGTTPSILQAETYEQSAVAVSPEPQSGAHHNDHEHHHDSEAWAPDNGWQRMLSTASANLVLACGFGLLLVAGFNLRTPAEHWHGLVWGAAGYATFYLSPSFGLPPELPGTEAAELEYRQAWWLLAVMATAVGLAILVFGGSMWKLAGVVILVFPHLLGAPEPDQHIALAPEGLTNRFIFDTAWVNGVFWLALGWCSAALYRHLGKQESTNTVAALS